MISFLSAPYYRNILCGSINNFQIKFCAHSDVTILAYRGTCTLTDVMMCPHPPSLCWTRRCDTFHMT